MKKLIDIFFTSILWFVCAGVGGVIFVVWFIYTLLKGGRHE